MNLHNALIEYAGHSDYCARLLLYTAQNRDYNRSLTRELGYIMSHLFCIAHVVLCIRFTCSEDGGGDRHSFATARIMHATSLKMLDGYKT